MEGSRPIDSQLTRTLSKLAFTDEAVLDAAEAVYFKAHPEAMADRLAASARVNELIASAIQTDPKWFWKNVRARYADQ